MYIIIILGYATVSLSMNVFSLAAPSDVKENDVIKESHPLSLGRN